MNRKYTPIQIIGTQRSGSNLLRLMINELDSVVAPHPPHILKSFMPLLGQYGDLNENVNFELLIDDVCRLVETNPVVWENVELDRYEILNKSIDRNLVNIFKNVYEQMAAANNAKFWCCKSMANVKYANQIEEMGLNPLYIRLIRDGRDVATSFKNVAVGEKHIYHLAHYWNDLQKKSEELVQQIGPERAITIKYEELIQEPEKVMNQVCSFLGVPYSESVFNYFQSEESKHTAESGFMWSNVTRPIIKNNSDKYKTLLTVEEVAIFESIAGNMLTKNGYAISNSSPINISSEDVLRFDMENEKLKRQTLKQEHLIIDLQKKVDQENLLKEIKARKVVALAETA